LIRVGVEWSETDVAVGSRRSHGGKIGCRAGKTQECLRARAFLAL